MKLWMFIAFGAVVSTASALPTFSLLRQDENPEQQVQAYDAEWWQSLKHQPLGSGYLSIGGEVRMYGESYENPNFGRGQDDAYLLQRYVAHVNYDVPDRFRLFGQLYRADINDRITPPNAVEENLLTMQQLFADVHLGNTRVRLGRQEAIFGSQRLVGVREGPNVRRTFTGLRTSTELDNGWMIDAFYLRPVDARTGELDDHWWPDDQSLWGVYMRGTISGVRGSFDLYFMSQERDRAVYNEGMGEEMRNSLGIRWFGRQGNWDWNVEAMAQWGDFGDGDIRAWSVASEVGYQFQDTLWSPKLTFRANVASGDDDPGDGRLGTFNPIYPRGNYFGESAVVGPSNFADVYAALTLRPDDRSSLFFSWDFFFRHRTTDGIYAPPVRLIRPASLGDERFVGHELSFVYSRRLAALWSVSFATSRFFVGDFLENDSLADDVQYFAAWATFKF